MKRLIILFLLITAMICIMGCSDTPEKVNKMYIEPAQLTEQEEQIAALLGLNTKQRIFDFVLDEGIRIAIQSKYTGGSTEYKGDRNGDLEEIGGFAITICFSRKTVAELDMQ